MTVDQDFTAFVCDLLHPLGPIQPRRMFGGVGLFLDGRMMGLIADDVVYIKADAQNREQFEAEGLERFQPFPHKPVSMAYYPLPEGALDEPDEALRWARLGIEAALRAPAKKPRARKTKPKA